MSESDTDTPPAVLQAVRDMVQTRIAELNEILGTTVGEYFAGCDLVPHTAKAVEDNRNVTIVEVIVKALEEPALEESDFIFLSEIDRDPINHVSALFILCSDVL